MRKLNWYYRQKVGYEDMRALQDNLEEAIQNTILDLFATGFLSGGVVQPTSSASMSVQVTAGRGYDESGNRIFIPSVQTIDLSSYRPSTSGRERWVLIAARFKRVESDPRTDGHGTTVMYRSDPSFEIVVRAGSEAAIGSAQKPAKQAGDVIRGYVRLYAGQSTVTASDISVAEAENLTRVAAHEVRYGSETVESALNARLPSAGEKAALAGTAGTPSSSNRYVTNSDPRLTDARTPKAHASTHKAGGSDPLTPEDIGAAPASHTHSPKDVGLGNVQNYGIATQAEAEAGSVNNKYMTPLRVAQAIAALHANRRDNPHQVTATQLGLGDVLTHRAQILDSRIVDHNLDVPNPQNGYYVRWQNGMQLCWTGISGWGTQEGNKTNDIWVFPATFKARPYVVGFPDSYNPYPVHFWIRQIRSEGANPIPFNGSQVPISRHRLSSPNNYETVHLLAIGRWK